MNPDTLEAQIREALHESYDVQRELPGGGMSRVFLAAERALNRMVVIKVLPPDLAAGVNRERFRREIQLAAQLQHPHIVPLFFAGEHGDFLYYTMPYIDGESLKQAIAAKTHFTVREVVRTLRDVTDALAYAHARGVAHRDIKPGNILRTQGHSLVTDFGVAKALSAALPGVGMTTSGMAIGTPAYMAPEQLAGDPAADSRVDIYAVGLLAYELLMGESPFFSTSPRETMARQLTRDPESISARRPDVPLPLNALIMRCLAKDPDARPQTASQLVAELDALVTMSGDFSPLGSESKRRGTIAIGITAVVIIGGLTWYAWQRGNGAPAPAPAPIVVAAAPALTHEDSVAIARAVEKKLAERRAADERADSIRRAGTDSATRPATKATRPADPASAATAAETFARATDSLRKEMMREVLDSVARIQTAISTAGGRGRIPTYVQIPRIDSLMPKRPNPVSATAFAERAANMGPPRRVFVSVPRETPGNPAVGIAAAAIMDSLRHALSLNSRYIVIPRDSVATALAASRATDSISKRLDVELFASMNVALKADGFVVWQVTIRDLSAYPSYSNRSMSWRARSDALLTDADSIVVRSVRTFSELDRAPRRTAPPGR